MIIIFYNSRPVMGRKITLGTQARQAVEAVEAAPSEPEVLQLEDGKVDRQ